ncbi:MAG TPA: hypothetical protein VIE38_11995 [Gaiellaceae bacterium]|jgi:hypothetical protein
MVAVQERTRRRNESTLPASPPQPEPEEEGEPSFVRTVALGLSLLAGLIAFEIALMFAIAYLVTGRAY